MTLTSRALPLRVAAVLALACATVHAATPDLAPSPDERQLPRKMHSQMTDLPTVTVGRDHADIVGADNRALQAAIDYVANLGGGTVQIGRASCRERVCLVV